MADTHFQESKAYQKWLDSAKQDLDVAFLLNRDQSYTDTICYFCHQVMEKALKAYIISQGILDFPHTHNLPALLNQGQELSVEFSKWEEEAKTLNRYYLETKYPADFPKTYPRNEADEAIKIATNFFQAVTKLANKIRN